MGEPGLWKFSLDHEPTAPSVFVNIYNNMWNTNFPLWQEGSWSERVRIWAVDKQTATVPNLVQKSWEARLPLLTGVAEGEAGKLAVKKRGITISRAGVLVTAFGENPDGKELFCVCGNKGVLRVKLPLNYLKGQLTLKQLP